MRDKWQEAQRGHQQLNGSQIGAGLKKVSSKALPECVRAHLLLNASTVSRRFAEVLDSLVRDRLLGRAVDHLARE